MDTLVRERTTADRKAFVLSELAIETGNALAEGMKPEEIVAPDTSGIVDPRWEKHREAMATRESVAKCKQETFKKVLGECVFQSIPFDDHEKASIHEAVILSTCEMVDHLQGWQLSEAGQSLLDDVCNTIDEKGVDVPFTEFCHIPSLAGSIKSIACLVESRVVAAVVDVKARSAQSEYEIAMMTEASEGDKELLESRIRRYQKANPPSLIEALFTATSKSLSEAANETVPQDIIRGESVTLYTMMETLSAIGIMRMTHEEVNLMSKTLMKS